MSQIKHIDSTVFLANNDIIRAALKSKLTSVTTMPTLTDGIVGNTYLYTGATTVDFTTNTIYKAISDGGDPATLSWQSIELGAETIRYVQTIPTTGIENIIYGKLNLTDTLAITVEDVLPTDFADLDSDDRFTKTGDVYTAANTEDIRVLYSEWTTSDYEKFVSLDVTDGQAMVLTTDKGSYEITTANATVTFKSAKYEFYAGDESNQVLTKLGDEITIDSSLDSTSTNPVQNSVVTNELNTKLTQVAIMPSGDISVYAGKVVQYVGATNANYINGYFYKSVSDGGVTPTYSWEKMQVSDGCDTIQVEALPTASEDELGNIYEYVGTTTANYINGRFYRCVSDGASTPTYSWEEVDLGDGTPHWSGTRAEYEAIKDTLEVGTVVNITDDYDDGLEVVDVVEEDNMNPVTSNAVYDADEELYTKVVNNLKPTVPSAQVVVQNNVGDLSTAKSYTASYTGLLKVHFFKLYAGTTIALAVNGRVVDSVPNYTSSTASALNPTTAGVLIAFVKKGDSININCDGGGEYWYIQNITIQPISWFAS